MSTRPSPHHHHHLFSLTRSSTSTAHRIPPLPLALRAPSSSFSTCSPSSSTRIPTTTNTVASASASRIRTHERDNGLHRGFASSAYLNQAVPAIREEHEHESNEHGQENVHITMNTNTNAPVDNDFSATSTPLSSSTLTSSTSSSSPSSSVSQSHSAPSSTTTGEYSNPRTKINSNTSTNITLPKRTKKQKAHLQKMKRLAAQVRAQHMQELSAGSSERENQEVESGVGMDRQVLRGGQEEMLASKLSSNLNAENSRGVGQSTPKSVELKSESESSETMGSPVEVEMSPELEYRSKQVETEGERSLPPKSTLFAASFPFETATPFPPLASFSGEPTIPPTTQTLLTYRPKKVPNIWSDRYAKQYQQVYDRISKAFVKAQIGVLANEFLAEERERVKRVDEEKRRLGEEASTSAHAVFLGKQDSHTSTATSTSSPTSTKSTSSSAPTLDSNGFPVPSLDTINLRKLNKNTIIERLLDIWGWKRPELIAREKKLRAKAMTFSSRDVEMTNAEVYLLLKRDPNFHRLLTVPQDASFDMVQQPKMAVRATARMKDLDGLVQTIKDKKMQVCSEIFEVTPGVQAREELYQVISDLSGAFLESAEGPSHYRISYLTETARDKAKQLLASAEYHLSTEPSKTRLLASYRTKVDWALGLPKDFALYPHVESASQSEAAWYTKGKSLFRFRRVGSWFGSVSWLDDANQDGFGSMAIEDLKQKQGQHTASGSDETGSTLLEVLKEVHASITTNGPNVNHTVEIEFGNILHAFPTTADRIQSLIPPTSINGSMDALSSSIRKGDSPLPIFVPTHRLPHSRIPHDGHLRQLRRITYEDQEGVLLEVEVEIESTVVAPVSSPSDLAPSSESSQGSGERDVAEETIGLPPTPDVTRTITRSALVRNSITNCMLPDHPADIRIRQTSEQTMDVSQLPAEFVEALSTGSPVSTSIFLSSPFKLSSDKIVKQCSSSSSSSALSSADVGVKTVWEVDEDSGRPSRLVVRGPRDQVEATVRRSSELLRL